MDSFFRDTAAIIERTDRLRAEMLKRFGRIISLAGAKAGDRYSSAITQYQIKAETASLITTAEDAQTFIRQLQEMWLFGQLNTLGDSQLQQQTDEDAKMIAELLKQLTELQKQTAVKSSSVGEHTETVTDGSAADG